MTPKPDKAGDVVGPEKIWLQAEPESIYPDDYIEGVTWCADKINEEDIGYIRADLYDQLEQRNVDLVVKMADIVSKYGRLLEERDRYREALNNIKRLDHRYDIKMDAKLTHIFNVSSEALSPREPE